MQKTPVPDFKKLAAELQKLMTDFPRDAGVTAVGFFLDTFKAQAWEGAPWQARSRKDKNPRRRAILVQTGRLRRSIQVVQTGYGYVKVATDVPYAEIHNEGGIITAAQNVAAHGRSAHKRRQRGKTVSVSAHSVQAHVRTVKTAIPRRQFMGDSPTLNAAIGKELTDEINRILQSIPVR